MKPPTGPLLTDDVSQVPEAECQARLEKVPSDGKFTEKTAHQLAKISHLDKVKTDAFMNALVENRPDLTGFPFAMGDTCRITNEPSHSRAP